MTKNSKEKLLQHPSVREVVDEFHVICKCGKKIKLDCKFDPDFLERHSKSSACKLRLWEKPPPKSIAEFRQVTH